MVCTQADNLKVHSENCVVFLLSAWAKSFASYCSAQQLEQLADHVRVAHLSPSYLHTVLPNLEWFKRADQLRHFLLCQATNGECSRTLPQQWTSKPRDRTMAALPATALNTTWTLEQIESLDRPFATNSRSANYVYANGFLFCLEIAPRISLQGLAHTKTLGLALCIDTASMISGSAVTVSFDLQAAARIRLSFLRRTLVSPDGYGMHDCLGRSGPTIKDVVTPILVDGKLQVSASIRDVM